MKNYFIPILLSVLLTVPLTGCVISDEYGEYVFLDAVSDALDDDDCCYDNNPPPPPPPPHHPRPGNYNSSSSYSSSSSSSSSGGNYNSNSVVCDDFGCRSSTTSCNGGYCETYNSY